MLRDTSLLFLVASIKEALLDTWYTLVALGTMFSINFSPTKKIPVAKIKEKEKNLVLLNMSIRAKMNIHKPITPT